MQWNSKIKVILISIVLILVSSSSLVIAQKENQDISNNSLFVSLSSPPEPIRNVAEFERMEGVLIRYPFGISYQIIAEMSEDVEVTTIVASESQKTTVISQYLSHGVNLDNCKFLIAPSDSYWTRDYGPWFIFNGDNELGVVDFTYNRPRPQDNAIPSAFASDQEFPCYLMPLDHTGGNYMTDSYGISVSTSLVWNENSGYSHQQIYDIMNDYLGIGTYHVVPDALGDYIQHIDCWAKFLSPDTIMIIEVSTGHSNYEEIEDAVEYFENQTCCYGYPYNIERVYTHLSEPYINCLILNDKVLVPITGSQWDDEAIESYESALPGYEVLGFTGSWQSTDALHCRTKGVPDRHMLYIDHTPLYGMQNGDYGIEIQAKIIAYSGEEIVDDSTCVYWKEAVGDWESVEMNHIGNDIYEAVIYPAENGSLINYYIKANDESGRIEYHPFIGEADPHSFIVEITSTNNPPDKPDTPTGPESGEAGISYTYSTSTHDSNGDEVFYKWDWGDGSYSNWLGPFESDEMVIANHTWDEKGTYSIKVKAKDINDEESEWSDPLEVSMPKSKGNLLSIFNNLEFLIDFICSIINKICILYGG